MKKIILLSLIMIYIVGCAPTTRVKFLTKCLDVPTAVVDTSKTEKQTSGIKVICW